MCYLEAHIELVAETELEHGILEFTPIHVPQDQTVPCLYLGIQCPEKLMSKFRQGQQSVSDSAGSNGIVMAGEVRKMTIYLSYFAI